jgi:Cu(I)/Ag(I) efflux system membrane fusion protein
LKHQLDTIGEAMLDEDGRSFWDGHVHLINAALVRMDKAPDIQDVREGFLKLSSALVPMLKQFGSGLEQEILIYHCPMAFRGKGGDWIQNKSGIENPYFGSSMFTCGELIERLTLTSEKGDDLLHE